MNSFFALVNYLNCSNLSAYFGIQYIRQHLQAFDQTLKGADHSPTLYTPTGCQSNTWMI